MRSAGMLELRGFLPSTSGSDPAKLAPLTPTLSPVNGGEGGGEGEG